MLSRDDLFNRLVYLVPNAKFAMWPDDRGEDKNGYDKVVKMEGFVIAWYPENNQPLPSLDQLKALNETVINTWLESRRKDDRDSQKSKDLAIIAAYQIEKKSNPELVFRDYLDNLEQISASIA